MSLDWDITRIKDYETLCWVPAPGPLNRSQGVVTNDQSQMLNPVTHALIFATMSVGWGEITEQNYQDWYLRYRMWELCVGGFNDGITISLRDVHKHVGLRTNVFPKVTDTVFNKRIAGRLRERVQAEMRTGQKATASVS